MPGGGYSPLQEDGAVPHIDFGNNIANNSNDSNGSNSSGLSRRNNDQSSGNRNNENGLIDGVNSVRAPLSEEGTVVPNRIHRPKHSPPSPPSSSPSSPSKSKDANPRGSTTKYTAMRPTIVRALDNHDNRESSDPEFPEDASTSDPEDLVFYDSHVKIDVGDPSSPKRSARFNVVLCGLLTACVATVGFGLLYVFVILPAHKGQMVSPGGKAPPYKLKHLGKNEAITSCGLVRGTYEQGAHIFRGIPYAIPPTGSRRWKPPVPLNYGSGTCWSDVFDATSFGSVCAQPHVSGNYSTDNKGGESENNSVASSNAALDIAGSEDCLYLNVWTPSTNPPKLLPVLVWIHSGDFIFGSGNARGMTPTPRLAADTGAVYVSFNFRLGVFGFLSLDALREKEESPRGATGNYGIMDQQAALQWVKKNIRNFGGDPKRVTVFGHGSGATSIEALLLSPSSIGLFSSAWLTSPVALLNKTTTQACQDNQPLMAQTRCSDAACLRGMDARTLVNLWPKSQDPRWTLEQLLASPGHTQRRNDLAIIDGHVLHWSSITHGPRGPVVPVVIGTTYSDVLGLKTDLTVQNMTWDEMDTALVHQFSPLGTEAVLQIKTLYSQQPKVGYSVQSSPSPTESGLFPLPSRHFARLVRDVQTVCPVKLLADGFSAMYRNSAPVYLYVAEAYPSHELRLKDDPQFSTASSTSASASSSNSLPTDSLFVGWDMVAFFGSFQEFGFPERQSDISFRDIVRQELLSLARSGKPNASRWHTEKINTGILRSEVTVSPAPQNYFDNCDVFKQFGFFHYTWSDDK